MGWLCSTNRGMRNACKILVGKSEMKRFLKDHGIGRRLIKMDIKQIGCEDVDWIIQFLIFSSVMYIFPCQKAEPQVDRQA
jgi:hypothetical protein